MKNWVIEKGLFERPLKVEKGGIFPFVISHLVPEIFKIFVLCKLGTGDVIRCVNPIQTWGGGIFESPLRQKRDNSYTKRAMTFKFADFS